jgi:hypothetical protein
MLSYEVEKALNNTFSDFCENREHFYYCTLTISGDGGVPAFSAWSKEALEKILVRAMMNLDAKGLFELNQKREDIFINVEFAPPDKTDSERAYLLNPPIAVKVWLLEAAE